MIDRETVIQIANGAGIWVDSSGYTVLGTIEKLQSLIIQVQNEAFERAAEIPDGVLGDNNVSKQIRGLKHNNGETNDKR